MKTIGVIGLGIIGNVWARHYHAAGVLVGAWNRTAQPDFPNWKNDARAVTELADVTQIVVSDPPAVQAVIDAISPLLRPGKIVVQSSTIDAESSEAFLQLVEARGARYCEAPFSGSKLAAEAKKSVFFLGGDAALATELDPLLALVSATRFHIGTPRQATAIKLALNLNIAIQMQSLAEALTFARRAGLSDETFFSVLKTNIGYSGLVALKEPKLRAQDFSPQFSMKHLLKDVRLASRSLGCEEMPVLDTVRECLHAAVQAGHADEDFSALIKLLSAAEGVRGVV
jgi:3-hydroxyisobutyrate dehydrogenase-like beta-hydroxyacid dehydrogenase